MQAGSLLFKDQGAGQPAACWVFAVDPGTIGEPPMKSLRLFKSPIPLSYWLAVFLFAASTLCPAQVLAPPILRISIHDSHDSPIAGAKCSLSPTLAVNDAIANASSDEQGIALFSKISPGRYTL